MKKTFQKMLSLFLVLVLTGLAVVPAAALSGNLDEAIIAETAQTAVEIESAGIVLLKNTEDVLPLAGKQINVFGAGSVCPFYGGSGSGQVLPENNNPAENIDFLKSDPVEPTKKFADPYGLDFALFSFGGDGEKAFMDIKNCMKVSADGHAMGNVTLVGGCRVPVDGGASSGNLNILVSSRTGAGYHDPAWEYGKDYPPAFVQFTTKRNADELVKLMAENRLKTAPLTTHRMKLSEISQASEMLIEHPEETLGVILEMTH